MINWTRLDPIGPEKIQDFEVRAALDGTYPQKKHKKNMMTGRVAAHLMNKNISLTISSYQVWILPLTQLLAT